MGYILFILNMIILVVTVKGIEKPLGVWDYEVIYMKKLKEKRYLDMLWFLLGLGVLLMILEKIIK